MAAAPPARGRARSALAVGAPVLIALLALAAAVRLYRPAPGLAFALLLLVTALPALAYVAWHAHPAILLSGGIVLSMFSGNWSNLGLPELIAPDRMMLAAAAATVALRAPAIRDRARIELRPIHWLLVATVVYIVASALAAGTLDKAAILRLTDRVGAVPFLMFLLAPVILHAPRYRNVLLGCLVGVGLYLALTSLFEVTGAKALVFPRYISDSSLGIHSDRARGPFLEAVGNGTAIYIALVASVIAALTWRARWQRNVAWLTAALGIPAIIVTLTRSIWVGAIVATAVTLVVHPSLRRWFVPAVLCVALLGATPVAAIPGFADRLQARESQQSPIWDRRNLSRAALNMLDARPLFGFGWNTFTTVGTDYFQQGDYPLTAGVGTGVHSVYLSHLAELGLVGTSLWLVGLLLALWLALSRRGPPELVVWRYGLLAISVMYLVVSAFVYPYLFATLVLWTWAGVVYGAGRAGGAGANGVMLR
jgi:putative inorganic carbon (hco3(-)) transporter